MELLEDQVEVLADSVEDIEKMVTKMNSDQSDIMLVMKKTLVKMAGYETEVRATSEKIKKVKPKKGKMCNQESNLVFVGWYPLGSACFGLHLPTYFLILV